MKLICAKCKTSYANDDPRWRCDCGSVLDIEFGPVFNLKQIAGRKPTMWRYRDAIPIQNDSNIVSFDEGYTPLIEIDFNGRPVLIKQEQLFQTGSFKDRGASVLISRVKELGIAKVIEDSSGNAGAAIAAYCARAKIECSIFVPENTAKSKLAQIRHYGAKLVKVPGSREDTMRAVLREAENTYYASHSHNPFFLHGTKTFAYEVCQQLGWRSPDTVILPVGNGTILLGAYIGFSELLTTAIIDKMPRIIAVQSENCAPLYKAFKENLTEIPVIDQKDTIAEDIAIANPVRGKQIIRAVKQNHGDFITVSDNEIKESLNKMCKMGYYIEPTSAATIAGIEKYLPESKSEEIIVSAFTGHGLKSTEKMSTILDE